MKRAWTIPYVTYIFLVVFYHLIYQVRRYQSNKPMECKRTMSFFFMNNLSFEIVSLLKKCQYTSYSKSEMETTHTLLSESCVGSHIQYKTDFF